MEQTDLSLLATVAAVAIHSQPSPVVRTFTASPNETRTAEAGDLNLSMSLVYLSKEFPSQRSHVYSTVSNSLGRFFVSFLPQDTRIRDVLWGFEPPFLRIWTIMDEPDFEFERHIYAAERRFIEKLEDIACDFAVIYAFGKAVDDIRPEGAVSLK